MLKDKILEYLVGGGVLTRRQLTQLLNKDDRAVRRAVAELRAEGHLIVSSSHGKGYRLVTDPHDPAVSQYIAENVHRVSKIMAVTRPFMKQAEIDKLQLSFSD